MLYTADFLDYGIRENGKTFSPTMSEFLWFKLYEFHQQNHKSYSLTLSEALALIYDTEYYLASLVKKSRGKKVIQHGEIYQVNSEILKEFLLQMHADFADSWGMFTPISAFNNPIKNMVYFRGNSYWMELSEN